MIARRRWYSLGPGRTIGPNMHGVHIANNALLYPGFDLARIITTAALVAHLGYYFVFCSGLRQYARFINIMRKRFFEIHMFTQLHKGQSLYGMHVIGRTDDHRIDL